MRVGTLGQVDAQAQRMHNAGDVLGFTHAESMINALVARRRRASQSTSGRFAGCCFLVADFVQLGSNKENKVYVY